MNEFEPSHALIRILLGKRTTADDAIKAMHCIHPRAPASIARAVLDHEII
ncbi:MAG: hypothetical protein ABFC92_06285 [Rectinema sp.]